MQFSVHHCGYVVNGFSQEIVDVIVDCMANYFRRHPTDQWDAAAAYRDHLNRKIDLWLVVIDAEIRAVVATRLVTEGKDNVFEFVFIGAAPSPARTASKFLFNNTQKI